MRLLFTLLALAAAAEAATDAAQRGAVLVAQTCSSCHALEAESDTYAMLLRDGPPLVHAGTKFRRDWLIGWLQAPTRIRPAGYLPFRFTIADPDGDRVDETLLPSHPAVSREDAEALAAWFAARRQKFAVASPTPAEPLNGELHFAKILGCAGCHSAGHTGGKSGPELGSAAQRLDEAWLRAFVFDTPRWSPTRMPTIAMRPAQLNALVQFIEATRAPIGSDDAFASAAASKPLRIRAPTSRPAMLYQVYCSQCHGIRGNGKGINAPHLFVTPRDHTSSEEMSRLTDQDIFTAIKYGGTAVGKSSSMPSWGATIGDDDIRLLVRHVRSLSTERGL